MVCAAVSTSLHSYIAFTLSCSAETSAVAKSLNVAVEGDAFWPTALKLTWKKKQCPQQRFLLNWQSSRGQAFAATVLAAGMWELFCDITMITRSFNIKFLIFPYQINHRVCQKNFTLIHILHGSLLPSWISNPRKYLHASHWSSLDQKAAVR